MGQATAGVIFAGALFLAGRNEVRSRAGTTRELLMRVTAPLLSQLQPSDQPTWVKWDQPVSIVSKATGFHLSVPPAVAQRIDAAGPVTV